jgi:peroxiredoxin Q/BCP
MTRSSSVCHPTRRRRSRSSKFSLGFPLLGDEDHAVAEAYGVWVKKSMYGREYLGNERTTFVIGPDGVITDILRKVKPAEHDGLVLAALDT